jgi:hypothetical protein
MIMVAMMSVIVVMRFVMIVGMWVAGMAGICGRDQRVVTVVAAWRRWFDGDWGRHPAIGNPEVGTGSTARVCRLPGQPEAVSPMRTPRVMLVNRRYANRTSMA